MGPRPDDRGYARLRASGVPAPRRASMGPRPDDRGYGLGQVHSWRVQVLASMGPRPDDRGYVPPSRKPIRGPMSFNGSTA